MRAPVSVPISRVTPKHAHKGKSTMDDPHASGDVDRSLAEAEDQAA